jgi:uncharacterized membrane protein
MSYAVNPYQSPNVMVVLEESLAVRGTLTETMLLHLKDTAPWLRFVGILGFIIACFSVLFGLAFLALIPAMRQVWYETPGFEMFPSSISAAFLGSVSILCICGGALVFFPSFFIYRFGEKIRSYLRTGTEQDLELAFKNNKSLWKFLGVFCVFQLVFIPLVILGSIIAVTITALI